MHFHTSCRFCLFSFLFVSRGRKFYGKTLVEGIQSPSETIYMPHFTHHTVYNLDETVAVGDNPFFSTAIEESALALYQGRPTGFAHINGSKVVTHNG